MTHVIRQDFFTVRDKIELPRGYVILRKGGSSKPNSSGLGELFVFPSDTIFPDISFGLGSIRDSAVFDSMEDGDIGLITSRGSLRVVLSSKANHNTLLVTERCDNRCLFCSQPPKDVDDEWLLPQAAIAISAYNRDEVIGISGGEPLLFKESFTRFLSVTLENTDKTRLHVLTNGRAFSDKDFAKSVAALTESERIVFGIPLYAPFDDLHDQLVGAKGAFSETVKGLVNCSAFGIPVEIRVIPVIQNVAHLADTVEMITRCFASAFQISIMNLEPMGWAKQNWSQLYLSPCQYKDQLHSSIFNAERAGVDIKLFNYPLCHLEQAHRRYSVKSISDWKNYFPAECSSCSAKQDCCGFFSSAKGGFIDYPRAI